MELPSARAFEEARARMTPHVHHTPILGSRVLNELTSEALAAGHELEGLTVRRPTLEETYLELTRE